MIDEHNINPDALANISFMTEQTEIEKLIYLGSFAEYASLE